MTPNCVTDTIQTTHLGGDDLERCHYASEFPAFFSLKMSRGLALLLLFGEALHNGKGFVTNVVLHTFSVDTRSRILHPEST